MPAKNDQLQIRVTARQKADLKRRAREAGLDVSGYVLARVLPTTDHHVANILRALGDPSNQSFALAELNDLLTATASIAFAGKVSSAMFTPHALSALPALMQNYVAAMVEQAAYQKNVAPPGWVRDIAPLPEPYFATSLRSLRQHLIAAAPVPFKRRNLFVDAAVGDRV